MDELVLEFTFQLLSRVTEGLQHFGHCEDDLHHCIDKSIVFSGLVPKAGNLEEGRSDLPGAGQDRRKRP